MPLTPEQLVHLTKIVKDAGSIVTARYTRGAEEHGGNIWDRTPIQLADDIIEEAVDQLVYGLTLRQKLMNESAQAIGRVLETEYKGIKIEEYFAESLSGNKYSLGSGNSGALSGMKVVVVEDPQD